ncbi:MAG: dockerin type I domain-containing protein [Candidatus Zixiibacteriota bacterium]
MISSNLLHRGLMAVVYPVILLATGSLADAGVRSDSLHVRLIGSAMAWNEDQAAYVGGVDVEMKWDVSGDTLQRIETTIEFDSTQLQLISLTSAEGLPPVFQSILYVRPWMTPGYAALYLHWFGGPVPTNPGGFLSLAHLEFALKRPRGLSTPIDFDSWNHNELSLGVSGPIFSPQDSAMESTSIIIPPDPCCAVAGDANSDGGVNVGDVTSLIARIFAAAAAPPCLGSADANADGRVNISDVTFLISRVFAGGGPPVCGPVGIL